MNNNKSVSVNIGGGFTGMLTLIFITLKLLGVIDWSWIWVLSPLWIGFALVIILIVIILIILFIKGKIESKRYGI